MRIISGKYKGKKLIGDNIIGTRPTMDRVKESLFGIIQNKVKDSVCLDLFAGSGSLGLEALSNGAKTCYFVDKNKVVIDALKKNSQDIEGAILIQNDFIKALNSFDIKFDIIFLDPPYNDNLIKPSIDYILKKGLLNKDGIIVCEYENEKFDCELELIKERKYGSKYIKIYKN